ncbi:MAG: hypothetical protein Q8R92_03490 [Deltaproteobacteria bacterium]|nr:hypothetical protein [Deltaproteobacteria bacterium]
MTDEITPVEALRREIERERAELARVLRQRRGADNVARINRSKDRIERLKRLKRQLVDENASDGERASFAARSSTSCLEN